MPYFKKETPMMIEGSWKEDSNNDAAVQNLRLRGICESVVEARLQRLMRKLR